MRSEVELQQRRRDAEKAARESQQVPEPQGLLAVFTGNGKGKSTAAFGMAWRAVMNKKKVGVVQFLGGSPKSAEFQSLGQHALCTFKIFGANCLWQSQVSQHEKPEAVAAWVEVKRMMADPGIAMIICDEINPLIQYQYLNLDTVIGVLKQRRPDLHIVFTGRSAPIELLDFADLVTEMREVKHPHTKYQLAAQPGIEF